MTPLLNKYYWNEGILGEDEILKSAARLLNRKSLDLFKEVYSIILGIFSLLVEYGIFSKYWPHFLAAGVAGQI